MKLQRLWSMVLVLALVFGAMTTQTFSQAKAKKDKAAKVKTFGAPSTSTEKPLTLAEAIKKENLNKKVRVEAKVEEVCQVKGCWVVLTDGTNTVRVSFTDYGFFVPKNIAGKTIICEGIFAEKKQTEKEARHFAEDGGKSKEEIEKIKGDQMVIAMTADTVLIPQ